VLVCLGYLTVSNEDILLAFVFELRSLRVWNFPICYAPEYFEMCNIRLVAAPEFLGDSVIEKCMSESVLYVHHTLYSFGPKFLRHFLGLDH
jgi:hypothetical protein